MVVYNVTSKAIFSLQVLLLALKSSILREVSVCPRGPRQSCSALQNFSWEALAVLRHVLYGFPSAEGLHKSSEIVV